VRYSILSLLGCCFALLLIKPVSALSFHLSHDNQEQLMPLYHSTKVITLSGYSVDVAHIFNERWSVGISGQQSDAQEVQRKPLQALAVEQNSYSTQVSYLFDDYTLSLGYQQLDFELKSRETLDATRVTEFEKFVYIEKIESNAIEVSISKDIDFDASWLTFDAAITSMAQTAQYDGKLVAKDEDSSYLSRDLVEQSSDSWLFSTSLSWSTLWSVGELGLVPSVQVTHSRVVAGDDVYLFNTVTASSRSGKRTRSKEQFSEPLSGDIATTVGGSLMVLITDNFSLDVSINRFYAGASTSDYFSLGLGWDF